LDLEETFSNLWANHIRLNPKKCVFGAPSGKLLGFMVFELASKPSTKKIFAIIAMEPISNLNGAQRLTGCLAVLSHFIS
jgi:hypothetical protein